MNRINDQRIVMLLWKFEKEFFRIPDMESSSIDKVSITKASKSPRKHPSEKQLIKFQLRP
jgi:hypothetical protein